MRKLILIIPLALLIVGLLGTPILADDPPDTEVDITVASPGDIDVDMELNSGGDTNITIDGVDFQDAASTAYSAWQAIGNIHGGIDYNDFMRYFYQRITPYENAIVQNSQIVSLLGEAQAKLITEHQTLVEELNSSQELTEEELEVLNTRLQEVNSAIVSINTELDKSISSLETSLTTRISSIEEQQASRDSVQNSAIEDNRDFSESVMSWAEDNITVLFYLVGGSLLLAMIGLVKAFRR